MRAITAIVPNDDWALDIAFADGERRRFDVKPLPASEAFSSLADLNQFKSIRNGGYFIECESEADLSADTLYVEGTPLD